MKSLQKLSANWSASKTEKGALFKYMQGGGDKKKGRRKTESE